MYLRSMSLSMLLIVANIGATPQQNLWGGIGCVAGGVILAVPAIKCMIVGFGNEAYEHKKTLEALGAKVKDDWRMIGGNFCKVGYRIDNSFLCISENREAIQQTFDALQSADKRERRHLMAAGGLTALASISILLGKCLLTDYMRSQA